MKSIAAECETCCNKKCDRLCPTQQHRQNQKAELAVYSELFYKMKICCTLLNKSVAGKWSEDKYGKFSHSFGKKKRTAEVENLVRESFWNVYRPGCLEHYVLHVLRNDPNFIGELNFVLEKDGKIIGQNVFVKAAVKSDDGTIVPIATMGPICIALEHKRQGYGKILLDYTLEKAKSFGIKAVCFEGDIDFYGKSGFVCASEFGIRYHGLPEGADASFFLCKELEKGYFNGITGEYSTPQCYFVDENEAEEFDKTFLHKEKLKLRGQILG